MIKKTLTLWQFVAQRLRDRAPLMLLLVVESKGSSPGRAGFKMAVDALGNMTGSIGGGVMEIKLTEKAIALLRAGANEAVLSPQIHRKNGDAHASGMICSGSQTVLFFPMRPEYLQTVREAIQCLKRHENAVLSIENAGFSLQKGLKNAVSPRFFQAAADSFRYEENVGPLHQLYIVGGGHCSLALSTLMAGMDFHISVCDDRPDLNTLKSNRFAHQVKVLHSYDEIGELIPEGDDIYVCVMTLGYRSDEQAIRQLVGKKLRYLSVLGSKAKMAVLLRQLREEGIAPEWLESIRTPAGISIAAHTPEEIAVSIAAEIIAVKNGALDSPGDYFRRRILPM